MTMKYKITHTTKYSYDAPVPVCQNIVFLAPRDTANQSCSRHRLTVKPTTSSTQKRTDYFGNHVASFSIDRSHKILQITAISTVAVAPRTLPEPDATPAWEDVRDAAASDCSTVGLSNYQFVFPSKHAPRLQNLATYARESFTDRRPILAAVNELNERLFTDITYDPKATTITTPISEVFEHRRGVCQDIAHLMLGCLRPLGIPARYVSGYLRTHPPEGKPRLVGADASHAWISVYCGEAGWIDVDPTNNKLPTTEHITVAWGRDFNDVCPVSGMFTGGGKHVLSVSVDVAPVEES